MLEEHEELKFCLFTFDEFSNHKKPKILCIEWLRTKYLILKIIIISQYYTNKKGFQN
jgi:hypothetical protein